MIYFVRSGDGVKIGSRVRTLVSFVLFAVGLLMVLVFVDGSPEQIEIAANVPVLLPEPAAPEQVHTQRPPSSTAHEAGAVTTCEQDWDPATHMAREEWDRACFRVEEDRGRLE